MLKGDVFLKFKILKANKKHIKEIQEISTQQFGLLGWAPNFFESELNKKEHFFYVAVTNQNSSDVNATKNFIDNINTSSVDFSNNISFKNLNENNNTNFVVNNKKIINNFNNNSIKNSKFDSNINYNFSLSKRQNIIGFINFMQTEGELGLDFNILNIATREEFKNKGVASALINFVFKLAKQRKFKSVWLEVRYSNNVAIHLYRKLGFQQLYIRKNYYSNGEDAIIFRKIF